MAAHVGGGRRTAARLVGCAAAVATLSVGMAVPPLAARAAVATPGSFVSGVSVEVPSLRTEFTTTFANPDGTHTTSIATRPVHYLTAAGWTPIDTALVSDATGVLRTGANRWSATFAPTLAGGVRVADGGASLALTPLGSAPSVPVLGADAKSVTYPSVWPGVDLRYQVFSDEVKEEIVLTRRPDRTTFSFATGTPLVADPAVPGGLKPAGPLAARWRVPPPVVLDKQRVPLSAQVARFVPAAGPRVDVVVDQTWLDGLADADFPVVVDPTLNTGADYSAAFEGAGHIQTCGPPCNFRVGEYPPEGWNPWRSLIHFPYESLYGKNASYVQISVYNWSGGWSTNYPMDVVKSTGDNWSQFAETLVDNSYGTTSYTLTSTTFRDYMNYYLANQQSWRFKFLGEESSPSVESYKAFDAFEMRIDWDYVAPTLTTGPIAAPSTLYEDQTVTVSQAWSHATDQARLFVCKAPGVTVNGCTGGQWGSSGYGSSGTSQASFVPGHSIGGNTYYTYMCSVGACSGAGSGSFAVLNRAPSAGSITAGPNPVREGSPITWTVPFTDTNTGTSRATVCKTANMNGGSCDAGQQWAVGGFGGSAATASWTAPVNYGSGPFTYFAAACDQNSACSTPQSGTFSVQDVAQGGGPTVTPNPVPVGTTATFSETWSSTEGQKLVVCTTNAISNGTCSDGAWASGSVSATSPSTAQFTPTTAHLGVRSYTAFLCTATNACDSGSSGTFLVQDPPDLTSWSDSPDPADPGTPVTFTLGWNNSVESVRAVVCKTNVVSQGAGVQASCPGGAWATGSAGASSPATASFTPTAADSGTRTYYAFACTSTADGSACSASGSSTFTVNAVAAANVTADPATQAHTAGEEAVVTITTTDAAGNPAPNAPLTISRSGANPQMGQAFATNLSGVYTYRYTGRNPGVDVIEVATTAGKTATVTAVWAVGPLGAYPSDTCAAGGNVVGGYVGDTYLHVRQDANPADPDERQICVAGQASGSHLGGLLRVSAGAGSVSPDVGVDTTATDAASCLPIGEHVEGGRLNGEDFTVDVAPNPDGTFGAWICVQYGSTYVRLRVTASEAVTVGFLPDQTTSHSTYAAPAQTAQWSATCRANGGTRVLDLLVGTSTPVVLYTWSESSTKSHVCVRAGSTGGRLDVDGSVVPGYSTGTTKDGSTPHELVTLETPAISVWTVDPAAPTLPAGVYVNVLGTGFRVTVTGGSGSVATFRQDPS